jgi:ribosomal protein S18 acetylase RimI-like enzyme
MQQPEISIELRQATREDLEELVTIRIAAMRLSLEKVGRFDPQRARARLIQDFQPENTRCLVFENRTIGFVIRMLDREEIALKHLYVLPDFQNRGVGKSVLDQIIAEAKRERRNIRLITLKESRANDFYLKHGFKHVGSIEFDNVYVKKWSE